jgi:hypothetical protein
MPTRGPEIMKFGHLRETDNATGKCRSPKQLMGAGKIKFEHLGKTKDLAATSTEASGSGGGLISLFSHFLLKKTPVRAPSNPGLQCWKIPLCGW